MQRALDWDDDHLYSFFVSGKLRDRDGEYVGTPMGDLETLWQDDGPTRSVQATRLDDLGLVRRRVMRYVFDQEHLVRIGVSSIRDGGPDDTGLPRTVDSTGEAPPQYEPCD